MRFNSSKYDKCKFDFITFRVIRQRTRIRTFKTKVPDIILELSVKWMASIMNNWTKL